MSTRERRKKKFLIEKWKVRKKKTKNTKERWNRTLRWVDSVSAIFWLVKLERVMAKYLLCFQLSVFVHLLYAALLGPLMHWRRVIHPPSFPVFLFFSSSFLFLYIFFTLDLPYLAFFSKAVVSFHFVFLFLSLRSFNVSLSLSRPTLPLSPSLIILLVRLLCCSEHEIYTSYVIVFYGVMKKKSNDKRTARNHLANFGPMLSVKIHSLLSFQNPDAEIYIQMPNHSVIHNAIGLQCWLQTVGGINIKAIVAIGLDIVRITRDDICSKFLLNVATEFFSKVWLV